MLYKTPDLPPRAACMLEIHHYLMIPQTVLALRGSYGVAKERGYDSFVDPVAPAAEQISWYFTLLRDTYPQKHIVKSTN